jgi:hypothetical protein
MTLGGLAEKRPPFGRLRFCRRRSDRINRVASRSGYVSKMHLPVGQYDHHRAVSRCMIWRRTASRSLPMGPKRVAHRTIRQQTFRWAAATRSFRTSIADCVPVTLTAASFAGRSLLKPPVLYHLRNNMPVITALQSSGDRTGDCGEIELHVRWRSRTLQFVEESRFNFALFANHPAVASFQAGCGAQQSILRLPSRAAPV